MNNNTRACRIQERVRKRNCTEVESAKERMGIGGNPASDLKNKSKTS